MLIGERGEGQSLAGSWEFPGGKVQDGEAPEAALVREILEELSLRIEVGSFLAEAFPAPASKGVTLHAYWARVLDGSPKPQVHRRIRWATVWELNRYRFASADREIVRLLPREGVQISQKLDEKRDRDVTS